MNKTLAIRHEDKYLMERRSAITPEHAQKLIDKGLKIIVESSEKRIFKDAEYEAVGAQIVTDISSGPVVFGVKEMPLDIFENHKTYVFFSHTIKGQEYNMPLLKRMIEKKINLIEYEKIANEKNQRLIFFGRFAGLAGMINSLWSFGLRMKEKGMDTPFLELKQSHKYDSLDEAKEAIKKVGIKIREEGLPADLKPMVIGITGYGNVAKGAMEIADLLPITEISPDELKSLHDSPHLPSNLIYRVTFKEMHLSQLKDGDASQFDLQDYYNHPEKYESQFEQYIPHLTILMNCMYWDDRYPRIVTKKYLKELYAKGEPQLKVIGDVTCDPDGSIEATHKGTEIEDPIFVYDPATDTPKMGAQGDGILIMSVDILPSELPRDASKAFADALLDYVEPITTCDYSEKFEDLQLPAPIKKALILHNGEFTPDYEYMKDFLK
jgi:alpha-aminoadipic semialdehyde synthase